MRALCGSQGKRGGWAGRAGDSLIKTAQLICVLSKGTTVSSVRAQMVLCLEGERVSEEVLSIDFSFQALACLKYCLLQPELK